MRFRHHPAASRVHFGGMSHQTKSFHFIRTADLGLVIYRPYSANYRYALPNGFFQVIAAGLPLVRAALPEIEAAIRPPPRWRPSRSSRPAVLGRRDLALCKRHRRVAYCGRGAGARAAVGGGVASAQMASSIEVTDRPVRIRQTEAVARR